MLPGWYGFGAALAASRDELAEHCARWRASFPFFGTLLRNVERALAVADLAIFERYARELVADDGAARALRGAHPRRSTTRRVAAVLQLLGHDRLLEDDPTLARSIALRNPYVDPISFLQVRLLRAYRAGAQARPGAAPTRSGSRSTASRPVCA